jgi:hypothetical protein
MKLKRGQKLCKNCNGINGARAYICKHCNTEFAIGVQAKNKFKRKKVKKFIDIDWKSLSEGDKIKVFGRSGSYYINSEGEKMYMSDPGIYTVKEIKEDGLVVHGQNNGFGYIYMGKEEPSLNIPNMYRCPHKIVKINTPVPLAS